MQTGPQLTQNTQQKMQQKMALSMVQLQSLHFLSLSQDSLLQEIDKIAQENPALKVIQKSPSYSRQYSTHTTTKVSSSASFASDVYQDTIENSIDKRASLKEYLTSQLPLLGLSSRQQTIAKDLIGILNEKGFFMFSPFSLLNTSLKNQKKTHLPEIQQAQETQKQKLFELIKTLQTLDPVGCFCYNTEHSLFVQACIKIKHLPKKMQNSPIYIGALYVLNGNLFFLENTNTAHIFALINDYIKQNSQKTFGGVAFENIDSLDFPVAFSNLAKPREPIKKQDIDKIIAFIKTLCPNPAIDFSFAPQAYITPDIKVQEIEYTGPKRQDIIPFDAVDTPDTQIDAQSKRAFKVCLVNEYLPELKIDPQIQKYATQGDLKKSVQQAKDVISSIKHRQKTVFVACCHILEKQKEFFIKGPGNLVPFWQKDLAKLMHLNKSTICRMAQNKYIDCKWGVFPIKYFFSSEISNGVSKDNVLAFLKKTIKQSPKHITDRQLSLLLQQKGIKVARRTVAKYRSLLKL